MPNYKTRGVALGMVQGLNRGISAFNNMRLMREEKSRKDEQWQQEKKISELQLKKLEHEVSPEVLSFKRLENKLKFDKMKADSELAQHELDKAVVPLKQQINQYAQGLQQLKKATELHGEDFLDDTEFEVGPLKYNKRSSGSMTENQIIGQQTKKNNVLQAIKLGKIPGKSLSGTPTMEPIENPDQIYSYAMQEGVDMNDQDIQQALKSRGSANVSDIPEWVPEEKAEQYKAAKEHYSEDQIKKYLGKK